MAITNDTNFLLAQLEGRDARDVAAALLAILLLFILAIRIRKNFNQYVSSRLRHMEEEVSEKQKLSSLIGKYDKRINALEEKEALDSAQSAIYIQTLQEYIEALSIQVTQINQKLDSNNMELLKQKKESNETKVNELRDRLLQGYRYYTSPSSNPSLSWNEMEADAFWSMFWDYENRGGDGYMHTDVEPAMRRLPVTNLFTELNE